MVLPFFVIVWNDKSKNVTNHPYCRINCIELRFASFGQLTYLLGAHPVSEKDTVIHNRGENTVVGMIASVEHHRFV